MDMHRAVTLIVGLLVVEAFVHVFSSTNVASVSCDLPRNATEICRVDTDNVLHCNVTYVEQIDLIPRCVTQLHLFTQELTHDVHSDVNLNNHQNLLELVIDPHLNSNGRPEYQPVTATFYNITLLTHLKILKFRSSSSSYVPIIYLQSLQVLEISRSEISLGQLIHIFEHIKEALMEQLILKNVQTRSINPYITHDLFLSKLMCPFRFLQHLDLTYNDIVSVVLDRVAYCAPRLKFLDLSHNRISIVRTFDSFYNAIPFYLEVFNISRQAVSVTNDWTSHLYSNDGTRLQDLDTPEPFDTFVPPMDSLQQLMPTCPRFFWSYEFDDYNKNYVYDHKESYVNDHNERYVYDPKTCDDCSYPILPFLKFLDVSNRQLPYEIHSEFAMYLYGVLSGIIRGICFGPNRLEKIDASFYSLKYFQELDFQRLKLLSNFPRLILIDNLKDFPKNSPSLPSFGLPNLTHLSLYGSEYHFETFKFIEGLPALQHLNLGRNTINISEQEQLNSSTLEVFNLSSSEFKHVPQNLFINLRRLKYLDLSHNDIDFEANGIILSNCPIKFLSLRSTSLQALNLNMRHQIEKLKGAEVDLRDNPLSCRCEDMDFIEWLLKKKDSIKFTSIESYMCHDHNVKYFILSLDISTLKWQCNDNAKIIISVTVTLAIVLLILGMYIVYKKRWHLRHFFFDMQEKRKKRVIPNLETFEYDAFILYSSIDEDRLWVHYELRAQLEDKYGFKLCIHHRDFLAGDYIMDNVEKAIRNSRKVIAVISPNFVDSEWCSAELHATNSVDPNKLILLMFSSISRCPNVESLLRHFLTTKTYLDWKHKDEKAKQLCWAKMVKALYAK